MNLPEHIVWLEEAIVLAVHEAQLAEHGGGTGIRDAGLLASALARPHNALAYGDPDVPALAALYALGIIRNHPFVDGNKRVGTVLMEVFLELNGYTLAATDAELLATIVSVAAHDADDDAFTGWVREHTVSSAIAAPSQHRTT